MKELLQWLCGFRTLSPECSAYLPTIVKRRELSKNELLLEMGEVNENLYFISSGLLYSYYYIGEQLVPDWFFGPRHTVVSVSSFYDQSPSKTCIAALSDCELFYVSKPNFDYLCATFHEFSLIANQLYPIYLKEFHAYAEIMRCHRTEERYQMLRANMPELLQLVPGKLLAPWIGMKEETLSRVRGKKV